MLVQLQDEDEYADIVEDIRLECEECGGRVVDVQVPRICKDPCIDPRHIHDLPEEDEIKTAEKQENLPTTQVKRETHDGDTAAADSSSSSSKNGQQEQQSSAVKSESDSKSSSSSSSAADEDEVVTEQMVLDAVSGKTKVLPPMVGYAYVAFVDCEASANARKVFNLIFFLMYFFIFSLNVDYAFTSLLFL